MGKLHILASVPAPKQVLVVIGFAHHEDSADLCATDVKEIAYAITMELVLSHHESRCIRYSYMIVARRTTPFMTKYLPAWLTCLTKISYANSTEYIERELIALLLEAMGFVYNDDIADLSSTRVKDIAHHSPVKLVLSHQESRCICY